MFKLSKNNKPSIRYFEKVWDQHWYVASDGAGWTIVCSSFGYAARALKERLKHA